MRLYSDCFDRYYEKDECIPIKNTKQAGLYIKYNAFPVDIFWEDSPDNENGTLVFMFKKSDTKNLYQLWNARVLK